MRTKEYDEPNGRDDTGVPAGAAGPRVGTGRPRSARRPRGPRRLLLLCTTLFLGVLGVLGTAVPASAHAALRGTDPEDGTVIAHAPRHVTLTFTESVGLLTDSFRVYDPGNHRLRTGAADHAPGRSDTARVTLPADLRDGTYTVAWRVVSADSHPVSGALTFSVGHRSAAITGVPAAPAEDGTTTRLYDIARYLAYLAVALLLGTAAFVAYCRPPSRSHLRPLLLTGGGTLCASTVLLFLLRGPYEEGTSPLRAFGLSSLARTVTSRPGELLLLRLALLLGAAVLALVLKRARGLLPRRWRRRVPRRDALAAGTVFAVLLSLTWAASEHASAGVQVPLAITSAGLHLLAMAAWLGGLAALLTTLRRASSDPAALPPRVVLRFSRLAFSAVTVLVVTGVYQSWRGLGSWQALTGTTYGRTLLAKLAAVTLLLMAASWSRNWTLRLALPSAAPAPGRVLQPAGGPALPGAAGESGESGAAGESGSSGGGAGAGGSGSSGGGTGAGGRAGSEGADGPVRSRSVPLSLSSPASPDPSSSSPARLYRHLGRSVLAEVAVGVVVLVLTTLLTSTLPGRAAAEAQTATAAGIPTASVTTIPFDVGTPRGHGKVQITLDAGRVGTNSVQAVVYGPDGGLSSVPELRITLTLPARRIGPLDTEVTDRGGYWAADSFQLPMAGNWTMKATVRVSEVDQVTVSRTVRVTG
ncbi:copper resistance CopC/CopD family protein [Streptomyces sp. NPDC090108]|uniref:copper resistance CopC/CopD family protein n=1 Tax=Streptomyces sp. NPDC090108 TaxID=3365947 RepID=UPI003827E7E0